LSSPTAKDPEFESRVRTSFAKHGFMKTLGADLTQVSPGAVEIVLPASPAVLQQHGFVHAAAVAAVGDTAAGYAAVSLMPAGVGALTSEFKINLLAPAAGDRMIARAHVVKAGRTLTVAQTEIFAEAAGQEKLVALLTATVMAITGRDDVKD
jgi:uncharacterized protein (TIGR00369 family)